MILVLDRLTLKHDLGEHIEGVASLYRLGGEGGGGLQPPPPAPLLLTPMPENRTVEISYIREVS